MLRYILYLLFFISSYVGSLVSICDKAPKVSYKTTTSCNNTSTQNQSLFIGNVESSACTSIVFISEDEFYKKWGSSRNWCNYLISNLTKNEKEVLKLLSDEYGFIYFYIGLDNCIIVTPVPVKEIH